MKNIFKIPNIQNDKELKKTKKRYYYLKVITFIFFVMGLAMLFSGIAIIGSNRLSSLYGSTGAILLTLGIIFVVLLIPSILICLKQREGIKNFHGVYVSKREGD